MAIGMGAPSMKHSIHVFVGRSFMISVLHDNLEEMYPIMMSEQTIMLLPNLSSTREVRIPVLTMMTTQLVLGEEAITHLYSRRILKRSNILLPDHM
jgi:hypothetical protein